MYTFPKLLIFAWPLLLLALTALAGYAYTQIRYLSLPIPQALGLFTVVLPVITGISTQGVYGLIKRSSKNEQYQLTIPLIAVIGFQLVYETVVITLALTYLLPPDSLKCGLEVRWLALYRQKNAGAIRDIQEAFQCCGFNSVLDRGWPFDNKEHATCSSVYGRTKSCFGEWRKAEQINAGILLLVAVTVFIIKAISILSLLTSSSWINYRFVPPFRPGRHEDPEDNRAETRRLIEAGDQEAYADEPAAPNGGAEDRGPMVVPSPLMEGGREWRNEDEGQRT